MTPGAVTLAALARSQRTLPATDGTSTVTIKSTSKLTVSMLMLKSA